MPSVYATNLILQSSEFEGFALMAQEKLYVQSRSIDTLRLDKKLLRRRKEAA